MLSRGRRRKVVLTYPYIPAEAETISIPLLFYLQTRSPNAFSLLEIYVWWWSKFWWALLLCMVQTTVMCAKCGSSALRKNGSSGGKAKYQCTECRHQAVLAPAGPARAARYEQVDKLLVERNSQRSIVRVTGVARMTIAKLAKKSASESLAPPSANE